MKKLKEFIAFISKALKPATTFITEKVMQHDKLQHFFVGTLFSIALMMLGFNPLLIAILGLVLGIAKEVYDYFFGGKVEILDVVYTAAPGILIFIDTLFH